MNNTNAGSYNTWKCVIGLPALLTAILFISSTDAIAQSKTSTKIEIVNESEKAKQNAVKKGNEADDIIKDLISKKIISGDKNTNLSIKLNYEELIVNSKKMPEDLHRKMRER